MTNATAGASHPDLLEHGHSATQNQGEGNRKRQRDEDFTGGVKHKHYGDDDSRGSDTGRD
jgi:hypothetical protein